jgi:hypothetical protein
MSSAIKVMLKKQLVARTPQAHLHHGRPKKGVENDMLVSSRPPWSS